MMKRILGLIVGVLLLTSALPALAQTELTVYATAQRFERGLMIWRSDTAMIYVLTDGGNAYSFPASVYGRLPDNPTPASAGQIKPIFGFGKIWGSRIDLRSALGWPVRGELGFDMRVVNAYGATYLRQLDGTVYQLHGNGRWNLAPGFPSPAPSQVPPAEVSITTYAAFQPYQNGFMIWHADNGNIEVFYGSGQHEAFSTGAYASYPDNPYFNPPAGLVRPINGFGRLWGGFDRVRTGLGWATTWETGYQLTIGSVETGPVSFSLPDGRVAHTTFVGTWSFS